MDRYIELKKENNERIKYLPDDYRRVANELAKKVRTFAASTVDTEVRLKDILIGLEDNSTRRVNIHVLIPNEEKYIEEKIKEFSKKPKNNEKVATIICAIVFALFFVGWIGLNYYLKRPVYLDTPENIKITATENKVILNWSKVDYAKSYKVYYKTEAGQESATRIVEDLTYTFYDLKEGTYTFYVVASEGEYLEDSKPATITYSVPSK